MSIYGNNYWEIIKPAAGTNLVSNPSVETGTTNWAAYGSGTISRVSNEQAFGVYSMSVQIATPVVDGVQINSISVNPSTTYTVSAYLRVEDTGLYSLLVRNSSGSQNRQSQSSTVTAASVWQRIDMSWANDTDTVVDVVIFPGALLPATTFHVDALQVEAGASPATTYIDGDQPGCRWNGARHASTSKRDGQSREGGEVINLNDDYDIIVRQQPGVGMPPVENIFTDLGLNDGGIFQRTVVQPRTFSLTGMATGSDVNALHANRQRLIDAVKPDLVSPQQPMLLRYTGASGGVTQIRCHYDSGLEFSEVSPLIEAFSLRLVAYEPYWEEVGDQGASLLAQATTGPCPAGIIQRSSCGQWEAVSSGSGANGAVYTLEWDEDNHYLYVGGFFVGIDDATHNRISYWDGTNWNTMAGGLSGTAWTVKRGSNNFIYIGGTFVTASGTTVNRITYWNGTTYTAMGTGVSGTEAAVNGLAFDDNGDLFAVGNFDTVNGSSNRGRVGKWDGADWIATGSFDHSAISSVTASGVALGKDGDIYAVGNFDRNGTTTTCYIAKWDGSSWSALGTTGLQAPVGTTQSQARGVAVAPDGRVYVGGFFTRVNGNTASGFAVWDGANWAIIDITGPDGTSAYVQRVYSDNEGNIHITGNIGTVEGLALPSNSTFYNGTNWSILDTTMDYNDIVIVDDRTIYLALTGNSTASNIGITTIVNDATAYSYPTVEVKAPTTASVQLYKISNETTRDAIHFNLVLQPGERVTLDLADKTFVSNFRGNIISTIMPTSNLATLGLAPSSNWFGVYTLGAGAASATMYWKKRHWSIDGGS